ncbi:MAG TPA: carboxypeptidase-like regulatory domain-containing protein, partial [Terriglobales bacterium]|nr:carboxypeptidase-like regulatory domain-containing protein [Terriglobales bacterium]
MKQAKRASLLAGLPLLLLVLCPHHTRAQGLFGTISGTVTDPTSAAVAGATVKVTNIHTNAAKALTTNSVGVYSASSLNPGVYKVEADAPGFKTAVVNNVLVEVNANLKVDLALAIGRATETVVVTERNAPVLQTQQTDLGQTVQSNMLQNLPIEAGSYSSGRSPYSLLSLAAG